MPTAQSPHLRLQPLYLPLHLFLPLHLSTCLRASQTNPQGGCAQYNPNINNPVMNKLQLPQAKLLYSISELYRKRQIDETEKRILKEKVITDNVEIYELLEQHQNEKDFYETLVALVRIPEDPAPKNPETVEVLANVEQEEATSPWGEFLRRRKNKNQNQHKQETNAIKSLINPQKTE